MKIFITGGSGFIGNELIPLLGKHELLCLTRSFKDLKSHNNIKYISGDLSNPETYLIALEEFKPDLCIHLAWYGLPDYSVQNNTLNFTFSIKLIECLIKVKCRKIFVAGSCWEYGNAQKSLCETDMPINPGIFGAFKTSLYMIMNSICRENNIDLIWGRVFFVYGPGQRKNSLIPYCYYLLKNGLNIKINNPLAINDFICVSDVANAIKHLIELDNISGVFNIGSGQGKAVWEVVNYVASSLKLLPIYDNIIGPDMGNWANIKKISKLGWKSEISLENGIFNTISELDVIK